MDLSISARSPENLRVDCLTVLLFRELPVANSPLSQLDDKLGGVIAGLVETKEIKGKSGEQTYLHDTGPLAAKRLLVMGCGKAESFDLRDVQGLAGRAARLARSKGHGSLGLLLSLPEDTELDSAAVARVAAEGVAMALYQGDHYKEKPEKRFLDSLVLCGLGNRAAVKNGGQRGLIVGDAANIARNLINTPGNDLPPVVMAERARAMAKKYGLECKVLTRASMEKLGMGSLLGVTLGSAQEPRLIILTYKPEGKRTVKDSLGFVGKGITFDTGGISLKPSKNMEKMKYDMAGGAAVLGAMAAIAQLKPKVRVTGVVPAVENMPGSRAQRPGDVRKAASGKTIEVINTDAEGRLILADALWYTREKLGATHMVDLATLTGAVTIALGDVFIGLMANDLELIDRIHAAGDESGERFWQLPLDDDYKKQLKSEIADMKNVGGRKAGTITAGHFLKEFADPVPWAHFDIAGTAWRDSAKGHLSAGGTGIGVRTLVNLAMDWE